MSVQTDYYMPELKKARERIEKLQAALVPFAAAAECAESDEDDDYCVAGSSARHEMTLGDLRRARVVLSDTP